MKHRLPLTYWAAAGLIAGCGLAGPAQAEDFYENKTISVYIGYPAGSAYDTYARLLVDHIGRFIPGSPSTLPRNMPGAGSIRSANYIFEAAPKDGTAWGAPSRSVATETLLYGKESKTSFSKPGQLNWIGSLNTEVGVAAVWHTVGVSTWEEARKKPLIVAMSSSQGGISARAVNSLLNAGFQQVCCYGGGNMQNLAMERGEVEARIGWSWSSLKASKMDWYESGKIKVFMQLGLQKAPDLPDSIPLVLDLAQSEKDKQALKIIFSNQSLGRPFIMPPGVPQDRVAIAQKAFMEMVRDAEFLAAAEKHALEINDPKSGPEILAILQDVYASPQDAIDAARVAIKSGEIKIVREREKKKK